jgi:GNAT superfamily N-acetyltransferase
MLRSIIQPVYSKAQFLLRNIPDIEAYIQNRVQLASYDIEGVQIKVADTADFQRLTTTLDKFRDGRRIAERTARGDVCIIAYKHDALAHVRWSALKSINPHELGDLSVHLQPDEAWTYDAYTVPTFRRQGIGSEAKVVLMTHLAQHGIRCTYSDSRTDNVHSELSRVKKLREGRLRILGILSMTKLLGRTHYSFTANTTVTRPLIARLFNVPEHTVQLACNNQQDTDQ